MVACRPGLGEFFLKSQLASEVVEIDKRSAKGRADSLRKLRQREWDCIFVPHESVRTALWMTRLRAKRAKVGFAKWWNRGIFSHRVVKPLDFPDALRQLSLLTPFDERLAEWFGSPEAESFRLGAVPVSKIMGVKRLSGFADGVNSALNKSPYDFGVPAIPPWASMQVKRRNSSTRKIFLAPGSVWNTKRWLQSGYEELARLLLIRGYAVELVGSRDEKTLCDDICSNVPGVVSHAGETSLSGLVDLLSGGTALICNDSGAMHAAATVGLPTVALFGPTVLAQGFRPWQNSAIVVQRDLPCRPCGRHGGRICPIGTHECMRSIQAAEVMRALQQFGL